jgi:hypothetical protein
VKEKLSYYVTLLATIILSLCALVSTVALVYIAVDLHALVNTTAWDAPWLNVITRGPVQ